MAKKLSKAAVAAKIQSAVYGVSIPMMSIPALYKYLEALVAAGVSEEGLKLAVSSFLKPKESA
jgi:hypothetical protein